MSNAYTHLSAAISRDELIEQHRPFVKTLAISLLKRLPHHIGLDELIACGNLGLVEAAERYDPRHSTSFKTFAYYRIKGAMYDALRSMGPLSRGDYAKTQLSARANDVMQTIADDHHAALCRGETTVDEIAAAQAAIDVLLPVFLLSMDSEELPELVDGNPDALTQVEHDDLIDRVRAVAAELAADDRHIIECIYFKNQTISQIAVSLGISKSWASRLHAKAIKHMRELAKRHGLMATD